MANDWEYVFNALTFGGDTAYGVVGVEGLTESPNLREDLSVKVAEHGGFSYVDLYEMRRVTISGDILGTSQSDFETKAQTLRKTFYPQTTPQALVFKRPGLVQQRVYCKPSKFSLPMDTAYQLTYGTWNVQLIAEDPRIYADTMSSLTQAGASASGVVNNAGDFPVYFEKVRLSGPYTNITFRNQADTTQKIQIAATIASGTGNYIDVDFKRRTLTKNDGTNMYSSLTADSKWFAIQPGNTTVELVTVGGSGVTQFIAEWRSGWM